MLLSVVHAALPLPPPPPSTDFSDTQSAQTTQNSAVKNTASANITTSAKTTTKTSTSSNTISSEQEKSTQAAAETNIPENLPPMPQAPSFGDVSAADTELTSEKTSSAAGTDKSVSLTEDKLNLLSIVFMVNSALLLIVAALLIVLLILFFKSAKKNENNNFVQTVQNQQTHTDLETDEIKQSMQQYLNRKISIDWIRWMLEKKGHDKEKIARVCEEFKNKGYY